MTDKYKSFYELQAAETRGTDYEVESRAKTDSHLVVIAPHGGTIEPRSDKIADAIAGADFSFYCFRALKSDSGLHIKSHLFNEPECELLVSMHDYVLSIHGWGATGERLCIGGRDTELVQILKKRLVDAGFEVANAEGPLAGMDVGNITNRGALRRGVQIELTMALRTNAAAIERFTQVVRAVLMEAQGKRS